MDSATTAVVRQRLAEAEDAYHRLQIAKSVTVMQHRAGEQGTNVTYAQADRKELEAYILRLRRQLGDIPRRHAMKVIY